MGLFKRINKGLKKTRDSMTGAINAALYGKNEIYAGRTMLRLKSEISLPSCSAAARSLI